MSKLTLTVNAAVVSRAKRYAKQHGISISSMVEAYLTAVTVPSADIPADSPILRSVRGVLKEADSRDHKRYLATKYR